MMDDENTRIQLEIQRQYVEFLDDTNDLGVYNDKIKEMIKKKSVRLIVNINDLRKRFPARCQELLENGFEELPIVMKAIREVVATIDSDYAKERDEFFVGFEGSFGSKHVTPRTLTSKLLGNMVCVEGIATKCSIIRPKVVRSVHYCPATKKTLERRYADVTSFDTMPSVNMYPTKDDDGNLLETEYGLSKYRDNQTLTIQEMPEKAPTGQLPRSVDIILDNDLVDQCKPGDRILVVGVFRCLPGKQGGFTNGIFRTVLLANHITMLSKDANLANITVDDVRDVKNFSKTSNPFEVLARSLAPTIHGHEFIKKAVLCLLLGGVEKILPNGTRLRGDINVLLIGDPSVAKSQMLRYVANVAPRVVMTTGRGSSGVGLTAAVTTDMETGDRRLEAGAMVLADRGIVCIDEFDKMSDIDRTAIHEVMEQGRVTIAKAGIHARLNARTAVLAAANPVYGRYDEYKSPMDNIGLQDSLLSRFDLLFIVLDVADAEQDRAISEHVLRIHRYRNPAEQDGDPTPLFQNDQTLSTYDPESEKVVQGEKSSMYEKHNDLLHGPGGRGRARKEKVLSMEFMKKYIHIAKCIKPQLTTEAGKVIAEEYTRLRSQNSDNNNMARTQPITARSLETMIRLSTAHARARMSKLVTKNDALAAIELVQFAYFKKVLEKKKKRKQNEDDNEMEVEDGRDSPDSQEGGDEEISTPSTRSKRARTEESASEALAVVDSLRDSEGMDVDLLEGEISDDRYETFTNQVSSLYSMEREQMLALNKITEWMMGSPRNFTEVEIKGGIKRMADEGKVMVEDEIVFLI